MSLILYFVQKLWFLCYFDIFHLKLIDIRQIPLDALRSSHLLFCNEMLINLVVLPFNVIISILVRTWFDQSFSICEGFTSRMNVVIYTSLVAILMIWIWEFPLESVLCSILIWNYTVLNLESSFRSSDHAVAGAVLLI